MLQSKGLQSWLLRICLQCRRPRFDSWVGKIPWEWQPTQVFLPGESHGQRSLAGYIVHDVARLGHDLATKTTKPTVSLMLTKGIYPPLNNEQIHSSSFCMSDFLDESLPINYICPVFSLIHLSSPEKNLFYFIYPLCPPL